MLGADLVTLWMTTERWAQTGADADGVNKYMGADGNGKYGYVGTDALGKY